MKALHLIFGALFLYIAYLQFNDPDPLYWIIVYAGTAAIAFGAGFGRFNQFAATVLVGAVAAGMIITTPAVVEFLAAGDLGAINDMQKAAYVEPTREFGGLLMALALLLYYLRRSA